MLNAAICDDMPIVADQIHSEVQAVLKEKGIPCNISVFTSGRKLIEQAQDFHLVFLDLEMPEMDGLQVGQAIQGRNPECKIIIVSGKENRYKDGYEIRANWFVTKPIKKKELSHAIDRALMKLPGEDEILVYRQRLPFRVKQSKISYIQACKSHTFFYINGQEYQRQENLNHFIPELDNRLFVQINRSQIINLQKITRMRKDSSVSLHDQEFTITKSLRKQIQQRWIDFDLTYGGL